jgi:hypothetical protein
MRAVVELALAAAMSIAACSAAALTTEFYTNEPGPLRLPSGAELHNQQLFTAPICTQGVHDLYGSVVPSSTPMQIESLVLLAQGVLGIGVKSFAEIATAWGPGNYLYMSGNSLGCPQIAETQEGSAWFAVTIDAAGNGTTWSLPWGRDWRWPSKTAGVANIQQDFAHYSAVVSGSYHTGLDIAASAGDRVFPVRAGEVVLIQLNGGLVDPSRPCRQMSKPSNCADHGFGNTVIVRHGMSARLPLYSQYSHLQDIPIELQQRCGTPSGSTGRTVCTLPVPVDPSTSIGTVGGTGYGAQGAWPVHLHMEVKGSATLGTAANDSGEFGYTKSHPQELGFSDPATLYHARIPQTLFAPVRPVASAPLLMGSWSIRGFALPAGGRHGCASQRGSLCRCATAAVRVMPSRVATAPAPKCGLQEKGGLFRG